MLLTVMTTTKKIGVIIGLIVECDSLCGSLEPKEVVL